MVGLKSPAPIVARLTVIGSGRFTTYSTLGSRVTVYDTSSTNPKPKARPIRFDQSTIG